MIYYNTDNQEKESHLDQLYSLLTDILIEEEVKDDETDERCVS